YFLFYFFFFFFFLIIFSFFFFFFSSRRRHTRCSRDWSSDVCSSDLHRDLGELADEALENAPPDLGMRHFAAAEEDRRLHLVAIGEEALDVLLLEVVVVLVDLRAELDLLDLDHPLVLFRLAAALLLLVLVLAEIHDSADRRYRSR